MNKQEAQARADRIGAFLGEIASLERDGVVALDASQRQAIADHYDSLLRTLKTDFDVDLADVQRRMSTGMRIASLVGALALAAAVFLFFYRIWGLLATPWQVVLVMSAPLVGIALIEIAWRTDRSRHFVFIAALIACAGIWINVVMLGDIFAMTDSPAALAVWAAFALAIGYPYGLRLLVAVGLALTMAFAAAANLSWRGIEWTSFPERPEAFLLLGPIVFAIGVAARNGGARRFEAVYRIVGLCTLLGALWALSIDASLSVLPWRETPIKALYQVLGFLCSGAAAAIGLRSEWVETMNIGAAAFVVFLYTKFYQWWWDWMPAYLFFFIVGAIAVAVILVLRRARTAALQARPV